MRKLDLPPMTLGESPLWDDKTGTLYTVDIEGKLLYAYDWVEQRLHDTFRLPQKVGFVALCDRGLAVGLEDGIYRLDPLTKLHSAQPICGERFNDGKADPRGGIFAGTIDKGGQGCLYRLHQGRLSVALDQVTISNGLAWTQDEKTMYYCDTATSRINAFSYCADTGFLTGRREVRRFEAGEGRPDGMTIDRDGMLWVALWGGGRVVRFNPANGELLKTFRVPASYTSSCAFVGEDLDHLVVTTAMKPNEAESGFVFCLPLDGIRGLPSFRYRV